MKEILAFVTVVCLMACQDSVLKEKQNMVFIPSGEFEMGSQDQEAFKEEATTHLVQISGFWMDKYEVSNEEFATFIKETAYVTTAEKPLDWNEISKTLAVGTPKPHDSLLRPSSLVFNPDPNLKSLDDYMQWWHWTAGADWNHPFGPESDILDKNTHPVVQISWDDANAYCKWLNKRLPTEAEWEWAARGGLENPTYTWGDKAIEETEHKGNFFQGVFPLVNEKNDGFEKTAPVGSFDANGYGLYDMAGNVWEWCADNFHANYYQSCKQNGKVFNPKGPSDSYDEMEPGLIKKVTRGGSYLCHDSYCSGYRVSRRMRATPETSFEHTGFRCVQDSIQ